MVDEEMEQVGQEVAKKEWKDRGSPVIGDNGIWATPSDNTNYLMQSLKIANLPMIDLHDPVQVQNRINEYFTIVAENGNKPTVAGLGLALNGMDRRRLWEIKTGIQSRGHDAGESLPLEVRDSIKKAYKIMEELWENYMQNGKINPVSGIFLGKNNYGYVDKQDVVITPNTQTESDFSAEDIRKRYALPEA